MIAATARMEYPVLFSGILTQEKPQIPVQVPERISTEHHACLFSPSGLSDILPAEAARNIQGNQKIAAGISVCQYSGCIRSADHPGHSLNRRCSWRPRSPRAVFPIPAAERTPAGTRVPDTYAGFFWIRVSGDTDPHNIVTGRAKGPDVVFFGNVSNKGKAVRTTVKEFTF